MIDYASEAVTQRIIDLIGEQFCLTSEWPDVGLLQRDLERRGEHLDVRTAVEWLDVNLGGASSFPKATLTIRGLARYAGAHDDLNNFVAAVQLAYARYARQDGHPRIGRDDFSGPPYELDALALRKLHELLAISWTGFGGGSSGLGSDDPWVRDVDDAIKDYRNVSSIDDYLSVQASNIPSRIGPRHVAQQAENALTVERMALEELDRQRETLRKRWAGRAGNIGYVVGMAVVSALIAIFLIEPAVGSTISRAPLAAVVIVALLGLDYVVGLNARNVSGAVRGWIARLVESLLRRIQYPDARLPPVS